VAKKEVGSDDTIPDEVLHDIINTLGSALEPRVLYREDLHEMTEEALRICQDKVKKALSLLANALSPDHWLKGEVNATLERVEGLNRYPF
jgi:hypothetical protein